MANLHIYRAPSHRTRRKCPFHKRLCYGDLQKYYDTILVFFDCGTHVDYGYECWSPPVAWQRRKWRDAKRRYRARKYGVSNA